jgi:hypothetical protein
VTNIGMPGTRVLDVESLLRDRLLTVANAADAQACASSVDTATGGLVISGAKSPTSTSTDRRAIRSAGRKPAHRAAPGSGSRRVTFSTLAAAFPGMPLFREPSSAATHLATAAQPFLLGEPDALVPLTLSEILDNQIAGGASGALTPTGFIPAGDADAMKAAVHIANGLDRRDTLLWMPAWYTWAREPDVSQFIAIARRSAHPIALTLGDAGDPLKHPGVPEGLRRIVAEVPRLVVWRTDLAGIDGLVHGALAAAVGVTAGLRHTTEPGKNGFSPNPADRTPRVLLDHMLRFVTARKMQEEWFASTPAPSCDCDVCGGHQLDRFTSVPADHIEAYRHNIVRLTAMHTDLLACGTSGLARKDWWREWLEDARAAHTELEGQISSKVPFPAVLESWSRL